MINGFSVSGADERVPNSKGSRPLITWGGHVTYEERLGGADPCYLWRSIECYHSIWESEVITDVIECTWRKYFATLSLLKDDTAQLADVWSRSNRWPVALLAQHTATLASQAINTSENVQLDADWIKWIFIEMKLSQGVGSQCNQ